MNETQATFTDTEMPTIIPDTGTDCPKSDREITYLKKKNIDKAIRKKLRKKDVYETDMHNIYNLIAVQTNEQLHENAASDTTFQTEKLPTSKRKETLYSANDYVKIGFTKYERAPVAVGRKGFSCAFVGLNRTSVYP